MKAPSLQEAGYLCTWKMLNVFTTRFVTELDALLQIKGIMAQDCPEKIQCFPPKPKSNNLFFLANRNRVKLLTSAAGESVTCFVALDSEWGVTEKGSKWSDSSAVVNVKTGHHTVTISLWWLVIFVSKWTLWHLGKAYYFCSCLRQSQTMKVWKKSTNARKVLLHFWTRIENLSEHKKNYARVLCRTIISVFLKVSI